MKRFFQKLALAWVLLISMLLPSRGRAAGTKDRAAGSKDITARINKVRKTLHQKMQDNNLTDLDGRAVHSSDLSEWVNWGKWGNWNNWNNWANWSNWGNWGNWGNY